jgi:putative transcriptional regulator
MADGVTVVLVTTDRNGGQLAAMVRLNRTLAVVFILLTVLAIPQTVGGFPPDRNDLQPAEPRLSSSAPVLSLVEQQLSQGKFLVASRKLRDPGFRKTVVLLIDYDRGGALGLVINKPTELKLSAVLPKIKGLQQRADTLYVGGPVEIGDVRLLVRTDRPTGDSLHIFADVYVTSSRRLLERIVKDRAGGERFRVYAGYAGWAPNQLEREVSRGDWHILDGDPETIFDKPAAKIWPDLIRRTSVLWVRAKGHPPVFNPGYSQ